MAKKYALLIANTEYRDGKLASLSHPGLAFGELAEALKDPARGAFNQVETLVNANLSHVLNSLDRFFSRKPADAVLLVYVGGHGFVDAQGELFLALKESDRIRLKSTALMAAVLGMNMDQCPSPHKVLLLDCHYHSPFHDAPAGAPLRIDPARIFAGRGLPKVIFSTGESTPGPVAKPPPPTATPVTGKLPIIPRDFTRTLAETLRTPSSAPGSRSAFTVEDWCKEVAIELKASRAEAPLLSAVGAPPTTVLRGASLPRPDLSLSDHSGDTSVLFLPLAPEPEGDWSRLSGIFPLEMIAPELAPTTRAEAPAGIEASDVITPPAADAPPAPPAAATDIPPIAPTARLLAQGWGDSFAALRARLEAQEEEERETRLRQEQEEAAQREKLNHWKQRWAARTGEANAGEELSPPQPSPAGADTAVPALRPSEYHAKAAALQKTLFMDNPHAEPEARSPREPTFPVAAAPVQGVPDGMATVIMPKEMFLNTGAVKVETPLSPGATLVVSREEFLGESHGGIAETPTREDGASALTGSPSAAALPDGRGSVPAGRETGDRRLALWILAGLLPIGLGLFAYFGYLSGLFAAFGFDGPTRNISVTQILSAPPPPAAPSATGTAPAQASAPETAPAVPTAPSPAVHASNADMRAEKLLRASMTQAQRAEAENLREIFNRFALAYPGLEGDVVITLLVAPSGEIEKGTLSSSTTGLNIFDQVVLGKVMDWKLQPFRSAVARSISVTLRFPVE